MTPGPDPSALDTDAHGGAVPATVGGDVDAPTPPVGPAARGPLRRFLETRGLLGGHGHPHVHVRIVASDATPLVGSWLPGPDASAPAVVLAHGFAAHRRKPSYARLADGLAAHAHVLAIDLRGHGASGGQSTFGDREALDVDAAVAWLRARGHARVVVVGASMGATSVLHAVATGTRVEAAVVVSAPAIIDEDPASEVMQRLQRHWRSPVSRAGMRWAIGVRVVHPARWQRPGHPRDLAAHVDVPLLAVHGEDDAYFPATDARAICDATPTSRFWLEPAGFGHAEDGFTAAFADRLGAAISVALHRGRFPDRDDTKGWP